MALAEYVGGDKENFARLMNNKAMELGLKDTNFVTPHGLDDPNHYTTAYELAKLASYAMNNPEFCKIVSTKTTTIIINERPKQIENTNELLGYLEGVKGVKTGFTNNAGRCLVTCVNRNDFEIITVVLGADTKKIRTQDSIKLIDYAYKNYGYINVEEKVQEKFEEWRKINENRFEVEKGKKDTLKIEMEAIKNKIIPIKNSQRDSIDIEINCIFNLKAPVRPKEVVGSVKITVDEEILEISNIYVKEQIDKKTRMDYYREFIKSIFTDGKV